MNIQLKTGYSVHKGGRELPAGTKMVVGPDLGKRLVEEDKAEEVEDDLILLERDIIQKQTIFREGTPEEQELQRQVPPVKKPRKKKAATD